MWQDNLRTIIDASDAEVVANSLGIPVRRSGNRKSILCPDHDDRHYGSCVLRNHGYHCFACGAKGDVIDLIRRIQNVGFKEACQYLSDIVGIPLEKEAKGPRLKPVLKEEYLQLIGLTPPKKGVSRCVAIVDEWFPKEELKPGQYLEWHPYTSDEDQESTDDDPIFSNTPIDVKPTGYCVVMEAVDRNPLLTLRNTNERAYRQLICEKATEAAELYEKLETVAHHPRKSLNLAMQQDDLHTAELAVYISIIEDSIGPQPVADLFGKKHRMCQNLAIEYYIGEREKEKQSQRTAQPVRRPNSFGKIKGGGAL